MSAHRSPTRPSCRRSIPERGVGQGRWLIARAHEDGRSSIGVLEQELVDHTLHSGRRHSPRGPGWRYFAGCSGSRAEERRAGARGPSDHSRPFLSKVIRLCPADMAGTDGTNNVEDLARDCAAAPYQCLAKCNSGGDETCLALAHAFDAATDPRIEPTTKEFAYARACSFGNANGCTNRAAFIASRPEHWLPEFTESDANLCAFRSWSLTCDADDAWGCAMLAIFSGEGRGTARNSDVAVRLVEKTCLLWPDSDPCRAATRYLENAGLTTN